MLYPSYSTGYVGRALYSTARDNGDSFSLSYTRNKAGKMQSTINQLKHGKGRAVRAIMAHREGKGWGRERGGRERGRGREREGEEEGEGEGGEGRKEEGEGEGGRGRERGREGREGEGEGGRGCCTCNNDTQSVVSIDHTALGYALCCMAISTTPLVPLLHVQHFLPCFN